MKKIKGFTLFIVLVFMQIFALLTFNSLAEAALLTKANFHQYQTTVLAHQTDLVLRQLEKQTMATCLQEPIPAANLANLALSWWQAHACQKKLKNQVFYYVWEEYAHARCCRVQQKITVVSFYRLSVFTVQQNTELLVQSVIAMPTHESPICHAEPQIIVPGRQLYRVIK